MSTESKDDQHITADEYPEAPNYEGDPSSSPFLPGNSDYLNVPDTSVRGVVSDVDYEIEQTANIDRNKAKTPSDRVWDEIAAARVSELAKKSLTSKLGSTALK